MIEFNGRRSDEFGLVVEHYPARSIPQRKHSTAAVPGRSGLLVDMESAWDNVTQTYAVALIGKRRGDLPTLVDSISRWLTEPSGYARLADSYSPGIFRRAFFAGPADIESWLNKHGRAVLSFSCDPRRFLTDGEQWQAVQSGAVLRNPTGYPAKPLIRFSCSGNGTLTLGGRTVSISAPDNNMMTLDCETGQLTTEISGVSTLVNNRLSGAELPELSRGTAALTTGGSVANVSLMARWWTL